MQVVNPSANLVHIDSTTGRASGFYYSELGVASTGVYAASGQFSTPDPIVAWGLVHPANNEIITENSSQVEQYKNSSDEKKQKLIGFFVGQIMKKSKGKANPKQVNELLKEKLDN